MGRKRSVPRVRQMVRGHEGGQAAAIVQSSRVPTSATSWSVLALARAAPDYAPERRLRERVRGEAKPGEPLHRDPLVEMGEQPFRWRSGRNAGEFNVYLADSRRAASCFCQFCSLIAVACRRFDGAPSSDSLLRSRQSEYGCSRGLPVETRTSSGNEPMREQRCRRLLYRAKRTRSRSEITFVGFDSHARSPPRTMFRPRNFRPGKFLNSLRRLGNRSPGGA